MNKFGVPCVGVAMFPFGWAKSNTKNPYDKDKYRRTTDRVSVVYSKFC